MAKTMDTFVRAAKLAYRMRDRQDGERAMLFRVTCGEVSGWCVTMAAAMHFAMCSAYDAGCGEDAAADVTEVWVQYPSGPASAEVVSETPVRRVLVEVEVLDRRDPLEAVA